MEGGIYYMTVFLSLFSILLVIFLHSFALMNIRKPVSDDGSRGSQFTAFNVIGQNRQSLTSESELEKQNGCTKFVLTVAKNVLHSPIATKRYCLKFFVTVIKRENSSEPFLQVLFKFPFPAKSERTCC